MWRTIWGMWAILLTVFMLWAVVALLAGLSVGGAIGTILMVWLLWRLLIHPMLLGMRTTPDRDEVILDRGQAPVAPRSVSPAQRYDEDLIDPEDRAWFGRDSLDD